MRTLAGLAAALLLLAGCLVDSADKYFPPAADLPEGLRPMATDSPAWKAMAPMLGMESNPGRVAALDRLPRQDLGAVASVDAYLLEGPGGIQEGYGILVVRFNDTASVGAILKEGEAKACGSHGMAHVLHDGLAYVLVGGDGSTEQGRKTLGDLARAVQARSGATLVC